MRIGIGIGICKSVLAFSPVAVLSDADVSGWSKLGATTPSATTMAEDSNTSRHICFKTVTIVDDRQYLFSVDLTYSSARYMALRFYDGVSVWWVTFDIQNGLVTNEQGIASGLIVNLGGGTYRCSLLITAQRSSVSANLIVAFSNDSAYNNEDFLGTLRETTVANPSLYQISP